MKKKDLEELKTKNLQDIKKVIADLGKERAKLILELEMGKIKNVHSVNQKKKDIAQAMTILRSKALLSESTQANRTSAKGN